MNTKNKYTLLLIPIIVTSLIYYSCENPETGDPIYKGMILGWVYDDSTRTPLGGVKVCANEIPDTLNTTYDSGKFHYTKITMPRGEYIYNLKFQKAGYNDKSWTAVLKSDVEYRIDSLFMKVTNK